MTIKKILFELHFELKNGKVSKLFSSQKELAETIVNTDGHYENINSLRPFLSQVLKPHSDPKSRPMPHKLKNIIYKVALEKLAKSQSVQKKFKTDFEQTFLYQEVDKTVDAENVYSEFKKWSEKSNYQFIVNRSPAELKWETHHSARILVLNMIEKLKKNLNLNLIATEASYYTFYFPNLAVIKNFWLQLRKYLLQEDELFEGKEKHVHQFLKTVNENGWIRVYRINEDECVFPYVYFELNQDGETIDKSLFNIFIHEQGKLSISHMPQKTVRHWYRVKYLPIVYDKLNPKNTVEMTFQHLLEIFKK